jgi:hypothetical protein
MYRPRRAWLASFALLVSACSGPGVASGSPPPTGFATPSGSTAPLSTLDAAQSPSAATSTDDSGGASPAPVQAFDAREFWERAVSGDPGAIDYGSLRKMISAVDVVLVARPTGIVQGRDVAGNAAGTDVGYFATVSLDVEDVVAGRIVKGDPHALKMELFMGASDPTRNDYVATFARYAASLPTERVLLFLTNKGKLFERLGLGPDDPGGGYDYYMIASGQAYVRDVGGAAEPWLAGPDWLVGLRGESFKSVVAKVKSRS